MVSASMELTRHYAFPKDNTNAIIYFLKFLNTLIIKNKRIRRHINSFYNLVEYQESPDHLVKRKEFTYAAGAGAG